MSLITIDRTLVSHEKSTDLVFNTDEDSENAEESCSKSSHSDDIFLRKNSAVTIGVKSQRQITLVRDHDELHEHLKRILHILRFEDYIKLIAKLENADPCPVWFRYLAIISTIGSQNTEESGIVGVDVFKGAITIGFILPIYQDIVVKLDGDGGFKLITKDNVHLFKPISVQALWAAHQAIVLGCKVAQQNDYHSKGHSHTWISYYAQLPASRPFMMFEWNKMEDIEDMGRATPPTVEFGGSVFEDEAKGEDLKSSIRFHLQRIMGSVDLEDVNVVQLREMLEERMGVSLKDQRHFIADQVLIIYGQMDAPAYIFDHLLLGSSFNASNGDELRRNNVTHIVNVTREVDNFFPADQFVYKNIRIYDDEKAQLLPFWDDTFKFINEARDNGTRCLVHCKMGISRSGSTVVAYVMKERGWKLSEALEFVKGKRSCVNPNANFLRQLETYQGILEASAHRHDPLFQQSAKITEATGVVGPLIEGMEATATTIRCKEEFDAFEPPLGPSGPVDLETELFAFKSFTQLPQIQKELTNSLQTPPMVADSRRGIQRRVLATTSQRIRHWHSDVYEAVGSRGAVVSRSKSSPTRVFRRHQIPTTSNAVAANLTNLQFGVHLVSSSGSLLNSTLTFPTTPAYLPDGRDAEKFKVRTPSLSSPSFSESAASSVSEHEIIVAPSFFPHLQNPNGGLEKGSSPRSCRVAIDITPSTNDFLEPSELRLSSPVSTLPSSTKILRSPSTGMLTLSLCTMAPDGEQSHKPLRTLSLRLRPDDSWIVKQQNGEEVDELPKTIDRQSSLERIPASTGSMPSPEEEEEKGVDSRSTLNVVSSTVCSGIPLDNPISVIITASQR